MFDAVVQLAFQNPEIAVTLAYAVAITLSLDRVPATVPFIPGLYVTGAIVLVASAFYFFAVPTPSTGLERLYSAITNGIFVGFAILALKKMVDITR